ncbi:hypothetical protein [Amycolatopsis sp. H20-H5]|uniref:hypothetical protein n=1 Tax=Amycolatopsis sp. H20-H5 TaxID=3046309 RepID=UPI002DBED5AD|nr:hypothetical protein [Amycolatopsis sp. H20-H5]MEC3982355.1 hypothetical protein [Amycolatopsis sp. H20-H5]
MKALILSSAAALGLFGWSTTAVPPTPTAPSPVWLAFTSNSARPGTKVSVTAACESDASPLTGKALRVKAPLARNAEGHQPWALHADAVVTDVAPGSYPVSFRCGDQPVTVSFTVLPKSVPKQVAVVPRGAPRTGAGGMADSATG